jgi:hypothetical protein
METCSTKKTSLNSIEGVTGWCTFMIQWVHWTIRWLWSGTGTRGAHVLDESSDDAQCYSGDRRVNVAHDEVSGSWTHRTSHQMVHSGSPMTMDRSTHQRCLGFRSVERIIRWCTLMVLWIGDHTDTRGVQSTLAIRWIGDRTGTWGVRALVPSDGAPDELQ